MKNVMTDQDMHELCEKIRSLFQGKRVRIVERVGLHYEKVSEQSLLYNCKYGDAVFLTPRSIGVSFSNSVYCISDDSCILITADSIIISWTNGPGENCLWVFSVLDN